jgi:hypothetical protein
LGHRDIENPGDKVFMQFRITKLETPIRGKVPLWEPTVSIAENQDSKDRESREPMHCGIEKLETPTKR